MGRGRLGQVLVTAGVVVLLAALLVVGLSRDVRDTAAVRDAARDLIRVDTVRARVTDELGRAIQELYAPRTVPPATERIVSNGYVVDDFQRGLDLAHRAWLYGAPMVVELDPAVVTQASVTGLRDADLDVAAAFPPGGIVEPRPIELPVARPASWFSDLGTLALVAALMSAVVVGFGAVLDPVRQRTLKTLARGLCTAGVALVVIALVLPLPALGNLHDAVAVLGALSAQQVTGELILAAVLVFVGLSLHASADRIVSEASRQIERVRTPRATKPVRSGAKVSRRGAERRRSEAIDAFFAEPAHGGASAPEEIVLDSEPPDGSGATDDESEPRPDDEPAPVAEAPDRGPMSPEQERAEALAAERREALERIDGTRSRYRTHLRR